MPETVPHDRPEVWLNCATSADGRLAFAGGRRAELSGPEDLARVQGLRAESDGILVGVGTVLLDDPSLRVHWELLGRPPGPSPTRIVLDSHGRTPLTARVVQPTQPTLIATAEGTARPWPPTVSVVSFGRPQVDIARLLEHLHRQKMRRLLVEGGAGVLASFVRGGWFDRLTVYVAPMIIGGRTAPTMVAGEETSGPDSVVRLERVSAEPLGAGTLLTYRKASRG